VDGWVWLFDSLALRFGWLVASGWPCLFVCCAFSGVGGLFACLVGRFGPVLAFFGAGRKRESHESHVSFTTIGLAGGFKKEGWDGR
jgi:hypothetical protein